MVSRRMVDHSQRVMYDVCNKDRFIGLFFCWPCFEVASRQLATVYLIQITFSLFYYYTSNRFYCFY